MLQSLYLLVDAVEVRSEHQMPLAAQCGDMLNMAKQMINGSLVPFMDEMRHERNADSSVARDNGPDLLVRQIARMIEHGRRIGVRGENQPLREARAVPKMPSGSNATRR